MQILRALSRKVPMSASVDFDYIAQRTEGFSGADLQALIYNAHLEVVHSSMKTSDLSGSSDGQDEGERLIEYVAIGGPPRMGVKSKAEEAAMQRRVRKICLSLDVQWADVLELAVCLIFGQLRQMLSPQIDDVAQSSINAVGQTEVRPRCLISFLQPAVHLVLSICYSTRSVACTCEACSRRRNRQFLLKTLLGSIECE